jgi:hypothetical protein
LPREFARVVFSNPDRFHLELDLSGMLRGDYPTRVQVGINAVRAGVLTPNELRQEMGLDTYPDGDRLAPQASADGPRAPATGKASTFRPRNQTERLWQAGQGNNAVAPRSLPIGGTHTEPGTADARKKSA